MGFRVVRQGNRKPKESASYACCWWVQYSFYFKPAK